MPKATTATEATAAGSVDPLSEFSGLSLFPRTIRASAGAPVPVTPKDLDSIHNFMKSLKELRSPEKLMSEAKKIVDGGADLLSNFSSFSKNVNATDDVAAKVMDRARGARLGLGIVYKKAPFSLRTSISQPPANLEPTMDIANLRDPDAFFDAYERLEKAKKEILKQQGVNTDIIEPIHLYKSSNHVRHRRPGILGRSYRNEHPYPLTASENDDTLISSQETTYQGIPSKGDLHEELVDPDPIHEANVEEVELAESAKKAESRVSDLLEELLSLNDEDLEGQGAMDILQEKLKIKPLDLQNLCPLTELPDVGRSNALNSSGSRQKLRRSSLIFDSVLKNLNKEPHMEQENEKNPVISSPTPPRSPFGSVSLLKKKILQPNPLSDPFSPREMDLCAVPNSSVAQPKEKEVMENDGSLPEQPQSENTSMERESNIGNTINTEENESNPSVVEEAARDDTSTKRQIIPDQQPEVHAAKRQRVKKVAGAKRTRDSHPMRKSLADAGTSFDNGVRRSTRVKTRPLEYWKGERLLYERVDNSLKLIGLKYFSPGKENENLKVRSYISSEKPELKELLNLAARH